MTSFLKRALKKSTYLAFQAGFLCVAAVFAWQTNLWMMLVALYFMGALAYAVHLYKRQAKNFCA